MNIGQRLHQLRAAKGFSQGDIEKRTGLLRCYVSRVENGHTIPNLETLRRWAAALDVEMYQLFFEGDAKPQAAAQVETGKVSSQDRGFFENFKNLDAKDRKFVAAMVRKMISGKRATKLAT